MPKAEANDSWLISPRIVFIRSPMLDMFQVPLIKLEIKLGTAFFIYSSENIGKNKNFKKIKLGIFSWLTLDTKSV
ncbi:hypothetical protein [Desulfovibrio inopinatus]|uniref:hypothetical protein n=1 Tax=Desulfovibrio inopinatus TaxID=102109 RepID=UPI00041BD007|nr:hypothetical protein [Desulfovibrio inopinatus]